MNKPNSAVLDIINRAWEGIAPTQDECAKLLALPPLFRRGLRRTRSRRRYHAPTHR